ncbi:hypothetical protein D3C87_1122550 [compost metagenome]
MKMLILLSFLGLFSSSVLAVVTVPKLEKDQYAIFLNEKYEVFKTEKQDGLEFKQGCLKDKNCQALKASQGKTTTAAKSQSFHPAASFCKARGGKNLVATNNLRDEFNFCQFSDGSMVTSWSLYNKLNKKK